MSDAFHWGIAFARSNPAKRVRANWQAIARIFDKGKQMASRRTSGVRGNFAMALGDSKTQLIRRAFESFGFEIPTADIVAMLGAKGVSVSPRQVTRVRSSMRPQMPPVDKGRTPPMAGILGRKGSVAKLRNASERQSARKGSASGEAKRTKK